MKKIAAKVCRMLPGVEIDEKRGERKWYNPGEWVVVLRKRENEDTYTAYVKNDCVCGKISTGDEEVDTLLQVAVDLELAKA